MKTYDELKKEYANLLIEQKEITIKLKEIELKLSEKRTEMINVLKKDKFENMKGKNK